MVSQKVTINNPQGLHMRPAGVFAKGMAKFDSDVTINFNGKATNGKSLLNIIGACIKCGSEVEIQCDGADEEEALNKSTKKFVKRFNFIEESIVNQGKSLSESTIDEMNALWEDSKKYD